MGRIIPYIMENKNRLKPPTSNRIYTRILMKCNNASVPNISISCEANPSKPCTLHSYSPSCRREAHGFLANAATKALWASRSSGSPSLGPNSTTAGHGCASLEESQWERNSTTGPFSKRRIWSNFQWSTPNHGSELVDCLELAQGWLHLKSFIRTKYSVIFGEYPPA